MRLEINRLKGLRNDLVLRIERSELDDALMSVANRDQLLELPGIPRHRAATTEEADRMAAAKVPLDEHLRRMHIVDASGCARCRAIVISNRNLGTNHGRVAWQRGEQRVLQRVVNLQRGQLQRKTVKRECGNRTIHLIIGLRYRPGITLNGQTPAALPAGAPCGAGAGARSGAARFGEL
jgi:hypothetical protein